MSVTLHVCTTCKMGRPVAADAPRPGARLLDALRAAGAPEGVRILPVACLSACDHGCNIALSGPGRWSYVYCGMNPDEDVADILAGPPPMPRHLTAWFPGGTVPPFSASSRWPASRRWRVE